MEFCKSAEEMTADAFVEMTVGSVRDVGHKEMDLIGKDERGTCNRIKPGKERHEFSEGGEIGEGIMTGQIEECPGGEPVIEACLVFGGEDGVLRRCLTEEFFEKRGV